MSTVVSAPRWRKRGVTVDTWQRSKTVAVRAWQLRSQAGFVCSAVMIRQGRYLSEDALEIGFSCDYIQTDENFRANLMIFKETNSSLLCTFCLLNGNYSSMLNFFIHF